MTREKALYLLESSPLAVFLSKTLAIKRRAFSMPTIKLAQGRETVVSEEDCEYLSQWKWCYCAGGYVARNLSQKMGKRGMAYMHRVIIERMAGEPIPEGYWVDHINGNGLDNRRGNLRLATPTENAMNKKADRLGLTSRYKGVYWQKDAKKWRARIRISGRMTQIGYFDDESEAARAYNRAAKAAFGEFARLNEGLDE